jgi:radical SAM protein with 4Fe4S-binding SPASM domain
MDRQFSKENNPFNFPCENDEENPLKKYFFEYMEEFPYAFYIELTNNCNLNCIFCARKNMTRELGFMSMELYKKIIDEIAQKRKHAHLHLYGIGESTLDPEILEKIKYAINKGVTNIVLFTNGKTLLKDDFYKDLVDTKVGTIGVDFDGFSKESYEKIRVGGNFEDIKKAIALLHEYIRKNSPDTRVELAYQIYKDINDKEVDNFSKWASENDYEFKFVPMHQWAGLRDDIPIDEEWDKSRNLQRKGPCCALWQGFFIQWDGKVALCFQDADGQEILGDVSKSSIEEVWKGKYKAKRSEHVNGIFNGLCSNCKEYTYNTPPKCGSKVYPENLLRSVEK